MRRPTLTKLTRTLALPVVVVLSAILAISLHRNGQAQGDDFALYLRQARSLFDGDIGQVVSDNRFAVLNSDPGFSPNAYPWVWPLLLSPFVHLWGLDYGRLKLVEVGCFCLWLVLLHGIVRRRIGRWPAIVVVAVFATASAFLEHTDQLLTEFPHLAALGIVIWWYDRLRTRSTLVTAPIRDLAILGALVALAFNVRRESIVLLGVIAVMAAYDVVAAAVDERAPLLGGVRGVVSRSWRELVAPFGAFAVVATLAQLLLPTDLLPDNGNSSSYLGVRLGEFPAILSQQLGLGVHPAVGVTVLVIGAIGLVIGVRRRPTLDGPLALLAILSALVISTHLRRVDRYWFQVTPWVVYFVVVALLALAEVLAGRVATLRRNDRMRFIALTPLLVLIIAHLVVMPAKIGDASDFNDAGRVQSGPSSPIIAPVYAAVAQLTPPDAIIAFYRARTMTLLTDRRSFQTKDLDRIVERADYFAQRRNSLYWQPELTPSAARAAGFDEVWSDQRWILWRVPDVDTP